MKNKLAIGAISTIVGFASLSTPAMAATYAHSELGGSRFTTSSLYEIRINEDEELDTTELIKNIFVSNGGNEFGIKFQPIEEWLNVPSEDNHESNLEKLVGTSGIYLYDREYAEEFRELVPYGDSTEITYWNWRGDANLISLPELIKSFQDNKDYTSVEISIAMPLTVKSKNGGDISMANLDKELDFYITDPASGEQLPFRTKLSNLLYKTMDESPDMFGVLATLPKTEGLDELEIVIYDTFNLVINRKPVVEEKEAEAEQAKQEDAKVTLTAPDTGFNSRNPAFTTLAGIATLAAASFAAIRKRQ